MNAPTGSWAKAAIEFRRERETTEAPRRTGPRALPLKSPAIKSARVELIRGDTIKLRPISWLWPGWLAHGKLHILGGAPGTGKTTIALSFAATVTRGAVWPDGLHHAGQGRVVIWSGEDDPADTLAPRLLAAGGDLSRINFVGDVREEGNARSRSRHRALARRD